MTIETRAYINNGLQLNHNEKILKQSILPKLPLKIIDVHSHLGRRKDALNLADRLYSNMISSFPYFTVDEHHETRKKLWNNTFEITQVMFGFPFEGIDIKHGNQYVYETASTDQDIIPFLVGEPRDFSYTLRELKSGRWRGVKMYSEQLERKAQCIVDFFPHTILDEVNKQKLPIILHLPKNLSKDRNELIRLAESYPDITFVIAHFGLLRGTIKENESALQSVSSFDNIVFDTSWCSSKELIKKGLEIIGYKKILYASDQPFNLIRARFVQHPTLGERIVTDFPYHWADIEEQTYYRKSTGSIPEQFTNMHFEALHALVTAVEETYPNGEIHRQILNSLFYSNAFKILNL